MYFIKKSPKYFGLLSLVIEWMLILYLFANYPAQFNAAAPAPLSDFLEIAGTKYIFITSFTLAAISMWIFIRWHLSKVYKVPLLVFAFSLACSLVSITVPYVKAVHWLYLIHVMGAIFAAVSFYYGMYIVSTQNNDSVMKRMCITAIAVLIMSLVFMALSPSLSVLLYAELFIGLVIHSWIVLVSYRSHKLMALEIDA